MTGPGDQGTEGTFFLDDMVFEGPNFDVEEPPPGLSYPEREDFASVALLAANGIDANEAELLGALSAQTGVLLHAAAHACGSLGVRAAVPALRQVGAGPDDQAAVEAFYALARLGESDAPALLRAALRRPPGPFLSPVLAAGFLAQLGDPSGIGVLAEASGSEHLALRMLSCKQLPFFMPFDGTPAPDGGTFDILALFRTPLGDPEASIRGQAAGELRLLGPAAKPLLDEYTAASETEPG